MSKKDDLMSIEKEVIDIIVEQLGVDPDQVTSDKSLVEDLNADSLDITELVMSLEENFGLEISQEDAENLSTVGQIVNYIHEKK